MSQLAGVGWGIAFDKAQFLCHVTPVFKQMISGYLEGQTGC